MSTTSPSKGYFGRDDGAKQITASATATFAGFMLTLVAILQVLEGISAVANDKVYVAGLDYAYEFDVTTWGWIHIVVGLLALATGIGILLAQPWAQLAGILVAGVALLANFAFMPYYPFWSLAIMALDVFVIWALCHELTHNPKA